MNEWSKDWIKYEWMIQGLNKLRLNDQGLHKIRMNDPRIERLNDQ